MLPLGESSRGCIERQSYHCQVQVVEDPDGAIEVAEDAVKGSYDLDLDQLEDAHVEHQLVV